MRLKSNYNNSLKMPIDINVDRRLRVTWFKYQNKLANMNNYYHRKAYIKEAISDGKCSSRWDAEQLLKQEIQEVEQQRRDEMNQIYRQVIAENKDAEAKQKIFEEEQKRKVEKRHMMSGKRKINNPITPRRSTRLQNKETNM